MKKSELKKLIKEEIQKLTNEDSNQGRVSFNTMIQKLTRGKELGEPNLSMMVDEVITDLGEYLNDTKPSKVNPEYLRQTYTRGGVNF
ncbi:MAG: hypothetical protein ACXAC7_24185 [Candidatus Hodarchaeales archaeon]|jgi:hypothetical protein